MAKMTPAELLAVLANSKSAKTTVTATQEPIPTPPAIPESEIVQPEATPELKTDAISLIGNLKSTYAEHGETLPDAEPSLEVIPNEPLPVGTDDKTTFERIHGVKEFNIEETDSYQLFHLINSPRLAREFGVSDLEIYTRAYNMEIVNVSQMNLGQIHDRIESLQKLVKANNAMQQACIAMQAKKEKEFRDSLIGLPIDEQAALMRRHEDEKWERENRKKEKKVVKVDKTGAIVSKKKNEQKSDTEKNITKLMKLGFSREDAEKLLTQ